MHITPSNFVLPTSDGTTPSERYLGRLCSNAFLYLWTYPNLYTDEGISQNGIGKELADVTVIFGDDVILFSDKECVLDTSQSPKVAWGRWYRKAVEKSVRQLHGAMKWMKEHPSRVFVDKTCTHRPSIPVPDASKARYHLIATTRGTAPLIEALSGHFQTRKHVASLRIDTGVAGKDHLDSPLTIGRVSDRHFVHVFDEASLALVLRIFDTATDFIEYLTERAKILGESARRVTCAGEEELVAIFLSTLVDDDSRHGFPAEFHSPEPSMLVVTHEHFDTFLQRPEVARKIAADSSSYLIDKLIDRFIRTGDPTIAGEQREAHEIEAGIRALASEGRFGRRVLADAILGAVEKGKQDPTSARRARTIPSATDSDTTFVILLLSVQDDMSYDIYRRLRSIALQNYIQCARLATPDRSRYVGLAFDHPNSRHPGGSEDLALFVWPSYTPDDAAELRTAADRLGIYSAGVTYTRQSPQEFPEAERSAHSRATSSKGKRPADKAKNRRKVARKSRKRNR